jgi:ribonuclease E
MDELHITAHRDVVLFILNHKRSTVAEIEARFGLMVILLSDDSLIAPEYKVDRVGWQGKAQAKPQSRQPQQPRHANKNVKPDTSDSDQDEAAEMEANAAPHPENDETGSEDGGVKRRRRGRRGGRRRRRRNGEDGQTGDNQTGNNLTASSPNVEDQGDASTDTANDGVAANDDAAPKAKTGRGRGRRVAKADPSAADNVTTDSANDDSKAPVAAPEPTSNDSVNIAAADDNGDAAAVKKPARKRKKSETAAKVDVVKAGDARAEDSKAQAPAKADDSKANAGDKPEQDAAAAKSAAKKPARKAAKKTPAKAVDANNAETGANNEAAASAPAAREAISSAPQGVVEIGSGEPTTRRIGWWSRN